jgi:phosphomannomutase
MDDQQAGQYLCPDARGPISRAVHLGRLARFYSACRQCERRNDTAPLSSRQVRRIQETCVHGQRQPLFQAEGVSGVYRNQFDPATARRLAAALAIYLRERSGDHEPTMVIGGDGRPLTPEFVASVAEGVRWAGGQAVEIGSASAPCVALAIGHLEAAGGILAGNPTDREEMVGLRLWGPGACPMSSGGTLDAVRQVFEADLDRPTRRFGSLRRFQADDLYLESLAERYHALRPLRVVLSTRCSAVIGYLERLTRSVACQVLLCPVPPDQLPQQVSAARAHLCVRINDDGQRLELWDEQGRLASSEQLLLFVGQFLLQDYPYAAMVLEESTSPQCVRAARGLSRKVIVSAAGCQAMMHSMCQHEAILGGGPSGRLWYAAEGSGFRVQDVGSTAPEIINPESTAHPLPPTADALRTLTLLLQILSQSDLPLSQVLDDALSAG